MASLVLPFPGNSLSSTSFTTQVLDASNDGAATLFLAPKTGTITKIGVLITAKSGTAPTYRFGVEGVGATRQPDGTYKASGSAYVDAADPSTGWAWRTLGASVSVTVGDPISATVRYQTGTIDGSNNITVAIAVTAITSTSASGTPFPNALTAGTWAGNRRLPVIALQYDDGTVTLSCYPASALGNNSWSTGSSPIYRGSKWTPAVTCQCVGVMVAMRTAQPFYAHMYSGSGSSPTVSCLASADDLVDSSGVYPCFLPFAPTTLSAGTVYRFVVAPGSASPNITFVDATFPDADSLFSANGELSGTTGVAGSPPTWTDYDNGTNGYKSYPVIPVIDDVTASGGGGLLVHPGMSGGMRG